MGHTYSLKTVKKGSFWKISYNMNNEEEM